MARVTSLAHGGGQGWALAAAHLCGRREMGSFSLCLSSFIRLTGETELPSAAPSQTASDPRDRTFVPSMGRTLASWQLWLGHSSTSFAFSRAPDHEARTQVGDPPH